MHMHINRKNRSKSLASRSWPIGNWTSTFIFITFWNVSTTKVDISVRTFLIQSVRYDTQVDNLRKARPVQISGLMHKTSILTNWHFNMCSVKCALCSSCLDNSRLMGKCTQHLREFDSVRLNFPVLHLASWMNVSFSNLLRSRSLKILKAFQFRIGWSLGFIYAFASKDLS